MSYESLYSEQMRLLSKQSHFSPALITGKSVELNTLKQNKHLFSLSVIFLFKV